MIREFEEDDRAENSEDAVGAEFWEQEKRKEAQISSAGCSS